MAQWTPHKFQKKILDSRKKYLLFLAGLQSGKTLCGVLWTLQHIYAHPEGNFLIGAPNYKTLNQSTLDKFFQVVNKKEWGKFNKQEMIFYLKTGGKIYFRSLDDPDGIEGMTCYSAWLDEADKMKHRAFVNAVGRVSSMKGQILLTTTPYGLGWVYKDIYKPVKAGDKKASEWEIVECRSIDNPFFPRESYDSAKLQLSSSEFERRYMGQFKRMTGLVYEDIIDDSDIKRSALFEKAPEIVYTIGGIDWGYTDPTAIVVVGVTEDKELYILEEYYKTGMTINEIVDQCQYLRDKHRISMFYGDPSQPSSIEEMNRRGIPMSKGSNEIPYGVSMVRSLIRLNRLFIQRNLDNLQEEITKYHYDDEKGTDIPVDEANHLMDALRYVIATHPAIAMIVRSEGLSAQRTSTEAFWEAVKDDIRQQGTRIEDEEYLMYQSALND